MSYALQLNPTIPVDTPKGHGEAVLVIDYGPEHNLYWVVFLDSGGACWTFENKLIRGCANPTLGRTDGDDDSKRVRRVPTSDEIRNLPPCI